MLPETPRAPAPASHRSCATSGVGTELHLAADEPVAEGAKQINGPSLTIDKPETALDEARTQAIANGQARADFYARALGKRVVRLVSVSEGGGNYPSPPMPMMMEARAQSADTKIVPGEQKLQVTLSMVFELQ